MKTILLGTLIVLSCLSTSIAQFRKGGVMTTGSLGFHNTQTTRPDSLGGFIGENRFNCYGSAGYLATNRLAVGIDVTGVQNEIRYKAGQGYNNVEYQAKMILPGLFARYYLPVGQNFNFYFTAGVAGGGGTMRSTSWDDPSSRNTSDIKTKEVTVRLATGVNYFITNYFALECNVGSINWSQYTEVHEDHSVVSRTFDLATGLGRLQFGVLFFFGSSRGFRPGR